MKQRETETEREREREREREKRSNLRVAPISQRTFDGLAETEG
jgi:hypothetical protein